MARSLTYQELEKINYDNEKKLLHLEQNMKSLQTSLIGSQPKFLVYDALIECVDFFLKQPKFIDTALIIYNKCKSILGTETGFVALVDEREKCLEVLHLDTGGATCTVNPSSPLPIRGLRKETLQKGFSLCCNDFNKSKWRKLLPTGHIKLQNVLFAPIVIDQISVGLLGFANKSKDFNQDDIQIAASFAKLASLALSNSKAWYFMKREPVHSRA
jgi:transcriptional regulator with GAF, ATPase, and Fis domain